MFKFFTNNTSANATASANVQGMDMTALRSHITALCKSVSKGLTFNGDAYRYEDLLAEADAINADIISNVFAITNITARLTGIIGIEDCVSGIMAGLPETPSMGDIKAMFDRINDVFTNQLAMAEKYQNVESIEVLKTMCGGKSVFTYAYAGINALYGKVVRTLGKHMPKVELKNGLLINLSKAIHRVGEVLWSGVKLVLKGLRMGLSFAAALAIQCGRVVLKVITCAVEWVRSHITRNRGNNSATTEGQDADMEAAMAAMQDCFQNYTGETLDTECVSKRHITLYQAMSQDVFQKNMMGQFTGVYASVNELQPVASIDLEGEIEDVLEQCFSIFNDPNSGLTLAYSMSVGDVVCVDNVFYRCGAMGWEAIQG